jgi:YVTN family beta-propeller protein
MPFLSADGLDHRQQRAAEAVVASIRRWLLAALGLVLATAAYAGTQDITGQFTITRSGLVLNRFTNTFDSTVIIKNNSSTPVLAPISAVVGGLPSTITLANQSGQTADGKPYVSPMAAGSQLASGGTLSFVLKFANPQRVTFTSTLQILYTVAAPPPDAPTLIRAIATGGTNALLIGRVNGAANLPITLQAYSAPTCFLGTLVSGAPAGAAVPVTTDGSGYFGINVSGINPGMFVSVNVASPAASPLSSCLVSSTDNDSWPKAFTLLDAAPSARDLIDAPGKARWYKFSITPGQRIQVSLTGLPADYTVAVFKDIYRAFLSQFTPATASTASLLKLTAEYAPSAFSPSAFSPSAFSPSAFSPSAFSPSAFSPSAFSPSAFSPSAFSMNVYTPSAFSPSAFSPSAFSPSAFSPSAFSPSVFSLTEIQQVFSAAQTRSIIGVSVAPGTGDKSVVVNSWNSTGNFYVRVTGRGDAFDTSTPFTVTVSKGPTTCTGVTDTTLTPRALVPPAGLKTVILTDSSVVGLDDSLLIPGGGTLRDRLNGLAANAAVLGVIVDVASDARVTALKQQAANNPACPFAKNLVAQEIKGIVDSYRSNPLRYVVIVGNDAAIPFFRSPDVSGLGEESGYVPPVQSNSPSEASLRLDFVLSQDGYGSTTTIALPSSDFPVPGLAVGRLVETPAEIAGVIDAVGAVNGVVVPTTSLVTGYDFLADAADAVESELQQGTGNVPDTLITPEGKSPQDPASWTATQLAAKLFGSRHDVVFLAGHFSANSALAADFSTSLLTTDLVASTTDFTNSIVFSAGCHSGYNLVDSDAIPGVTLPLDWAQAFARKRATLIAGTGYQYGDTDFIEYSERLYDNLAREFRAGIGPVSVGEALVRAKLDYLAITPDIRGIHEKVLREATLFGLPMLGVNMPAGRGGSSGGGGVITPVAVASGPANALGLMTYDLGLAPTLMSHVVALKNVNGGPDVNATYLSGPDGVVTKPGEPALPLVAVNVTPTDATLVLRGIGLRGGAYADSAPMLPFSGAPTTELRGVHVPFLAPVFFPDRLTNPNYFGALAGSGGTELLVTPAQHRAANLADGTSTERMFTGLNLRLYYSGNLTQAALSEAPTIVDVDAQPDAGGVLFAVQVVGDPAAAIPQVWVTYTGDGTGTWTSLDLAQCVAPLPAVCSTEDSRFWKGRLVSPPTNLKFMVQAVNGVGLVSLDDNRGAYYSRDAATPAATTTAVVAQPNTATVGDSVAFTTRLAIAGVPLAGRTVTVTIGGIAQLATTGADGSVTVNLPVATVPGTYPVTVSFAGDDTYQPSSMTTSLVVSKAASTLSPLAPVGAVLTATVNGRVEALQGEAVSFSVTGPEGALTISAITDYLGQATLPPPGLLAGNYTVSQASYGGDATYASSTVIFSPPGQFTVAQTAQTIAFAPLADASYGIPAFPVYALASSGLPVSYAASGACSVSGNSVQVAGTGSCMITASQNGDSNYSPATSVARTFNISPANQVIAFGPAPTGVTAGQQHVFVTATSSSPTSAPSTTAITFTSLTPAVCTIDRSSFNNAAGLKLLAAGQCTIAADQVGDANYNPALQATLGFTVGPAGSGPAIFTVTNLNDRGAGSLRAAISSANAAAPGPNIVNFANGLTGTVVLTSGQIQISRSVSIEGPGADTLAISGNNNSRIFSVFVTSPSCPAFEPGPDFLVSISGLALTDAAANFADSYGGAIYSGHSLYLDSVVIRNSSARSAGAVGFDVQYPGQALGIVNSQFMNNTATPAVTPVTFTTAFGGAVGISEKCALTPATSPVVVQIQNSVFSGNAARPVTFSARGGAIASSSRADITILDTRIVGNHVDAPNPPVAGQSYYGGGIHALAKSVRIERSEIAENAANDVTGSDVTRGAGLRFVSNDPNRQGPGDATAVRIIDSTISGNSVAASAGAIQVFGNTTLELYNTTVSNNSAAAGRTGGINLSTGATTPVSASNATAPTLKLVSSMVANSSSTTVDVSTNTATIPTFSINALNSLIENPCSTCSIAVSGPPGNIVGADPQVGSLAFNGGRTRTHALLSGSPAINAGNNVAGLTTDQRGPGFPRLVGVADMGAYEAGLSLPVAGGTYFDRTGGLIGTTFVFDPTTIAGTLPSAAMTGPTSWNAGNPFNCDRYQPPAAQPVVGGAPFAYFTTASGSLVVVDTPTNSVRATVGVGTNPYSAVVNPGGTRVYVSNFGDNTVSVVDASANQVIATVAVGAGPQGLAVNPSGSRAYVASFTAGTVSVIDAGTNSVIAAIPAAGAVDVVVNHAGTRLYVAYTPGVAVVDTATNTVIGSIPRGALSSFGNIAISADDARLYAWSNGSASVAVIDIDTSSVVATIPITSAFATDGIAVDPSGAPVYHSNGSSVSEIDPATNSVVNTIALGTTGSGVNGVAVTPDGEHVYAATANGARQFDTATNTVTSIATGAVRALGHFIGSGPRTALMNIADRSICWTFTLPVTGSYTAQGSAGSTPFTGAFSLDAANQLAAPQITSLLHSAGSVRVDWTATNDARSFLVRLNPVPPTGTTREMIVSGTSRSATLTGFALTTGATYQVTVFAFSQDLETPDPLASVFNISAHSQTFVAP